ncbi:hypothetical protein M422DRAFT_28010 [Sphaerobolus stellatus SS14]|nr:hypothetical protein M422DRAFT_28010 [Sphaerobolus stellatus SS14]
MDDYIRTGHPISFGLLIVLSIIEGSLAAWLTSRYNNDPDRASSAVRERTDFLLFAAWWTVIGSAVYTGLFLQSASGNAMTSVASHGIFLSLTWIFWTAGAIAITVALGGGTNCSKVGHEVIYCNQLNALEGFAWAPWIIVTIMLFFVIIRGISSLRRGDGTRGQLV